MTSRVASKPSLRNMYRMPAHERLSSLHPQRSVLTGVRGKNSSQ